MGKHDVNVISAMKKGRRNYKAKRLLYAVKEVARREKPRSSAVPSFHSTCSQHIKRQKEGKVLLLCTRTTSVLGERIETPGGQTFGIAKDNCNNLLLSSKQILLKQNMSPKIHSIAYVLYVSLGRVIYLDILYQAVHPYW